VRVPLLGGQMPEIPAPSGHLAGRRALVIERSPVQRAAICAALEREGAQCAAFAEPSEIEALADSTSADLLIVADYPAGADLSALRAEAQARLGAPCACLYLVYAARRTANRRDECRTLAKPFLAEDLVSAAESLLGLGSASVRDAQETQGFGGADPNATAGIRVLVAEDNPVAAKVIGTFLKKMGFEHTLVADGEAALAEALSGRYSIAIVDLRMPKLDGMALARTYRRRAPDRPLPIVALTANAAEDVKQQCLDAGMNGFLAKPVSPETLRETLERLAVRH
jgi:two-component system, sensor histidine kinase RpfC